MIHSQRLDWLDDSLAQLEANGLLRTLRTREAAIGAEIDVDGWRLINFAANDYLGLAADPRLAEAARQAIDAEGWGAGASPLIVGRSRLHAQLEAELAQFEQTEAALLFASGFAANAGTIPALVDREDAIFADAKNHASLIDGCRLARAATNVYPHRDVDALAHLLREHAAARRKLIVTDSLFSMDGNIGPLAQIAQLADDHGAMLLVDEAHATGVFGEQGRGLCEQLGVEDRVDVKIGTLSKAFGCAGGFVAGSQPLIDWLANRARSYVFSTAQPPAGAAAALAALAIVREEPRRRADLLTVAAAVRTTLQAQGWDVGDSCSQIIPVFVGEAGEAMRLQTALAEHGLFVPGIRPPSVPPGESLLRISLSYAHDETMRKKLCDTLADLK